MSWSHYLRQVRPGVMKSLGCADGARAGGPGPTDGIAVLAMGRPWRSGQAFGASLFGRFGSTTSISLGIQAYAKGFASCSPSNARVTIAAGTSNWGDQVTYAHGKAWARMVNEVNDWLDERGLSPRIRAAGANDIETAWNGPRTTRRWVDGYDAVARWPFYNYGDAGGCPPAGRCHLGWTYEDLWYVSWGARSAWPLPEIYAPTGTMAEQWARIARYSHDRHGSLMLFAGAMTQLRGCRGSSDSCVGMDNAPRTGWSQLWRALNRDPRTRQDLRWSTDIGWPGTAG